MIQMFIKWLPGFGTMLAMFAFVCVPGLIEEGYFLYGFITFFLSIIVGLCSVVYLVDPNELDD